MVCPRCITAVAQVLEKTGITAAKVSLGEVVLNEDLTEAQQHDLDASLLTLGFERIDDRKARLIESIKAKIISTIFSDGPIDLKSNWSSVLSEALHYEYNYLSSLFSSVEGTTLEQYIIHQKIERAKELLIYNELTLSEIGQQLGYSSVAHLSNQFKKITGLTPSALKRASAKDQNRKSIDRLF